MECCGVLWSVVECSSVIISVALWIIIRNMIYCSEAK